MKRVILSFMLITLAVLFSPNTVSTGTSKTLLKFVDNINAQRMYTAASAWEQSDKDILYATTPEYELPDLNWTSFNKRNKGTYLIQEDAIRDIDILFELIRSSYGGYFYFGGDTAFTLVKNQILTYVNNQNSITVRELKHILQKELAALIRDKHFSIETPLWTVNPSYYWYYVPNLFFNLSEIPGQYLPYIKPTISNEGHLCYGFAYWGNDAKNLPTEVVINGKIYVLNWVQETPVEKQVTQAYSIERKNGFPILKLHSLVANNATQKQLEQLSTSAEQFVNEPIFVIDLRGNSGGSTFYASNWLNAFLKEDVSIKVITAQRCSPLILNLVKGAANSEELKNFANSIEENLGSWIRKISEASYKYNDHLIFVLSDQNSGSAAEEFIRELRTLSNVVFVGTNTSGATLCGNVCSMFLPESGIEVRFGTNIAFYEAVENIEGIGIEPNLWVPSSRAEEAVLQLCQYYNIKD